MGIIPEDQPRFVSRRQNHAKGVRVQPRKISELRTSLRLSDIPLLIILMLVTAVLVSAQQSTIQTAVLNNPEVAYPVRFDISPPLRDMATEAPIQGGGEVELQVRRPKLQQLMASANHNGGKYSAELGSSVTPEPNGDSSLYQTVTIPSTSVSAGLHFYYWAACSDIVTNDWQEAQIQNSSGTKLAQVMKVCSNTQTWTHVYVNLFPYKGQTLLIYFNTHGNGNNKLAYMYLDDVQVYVK